MSPRSTARLELAAAAILFSTGGAAIKAADFTGWQITCLRSGIAAIAIWLMTRQARGRWTARHLVVGVAYAACLTLFVLANRLTTAANTIYLQSTAPLYLAILAPWLLREPTRRQDLAFMAAVGVGLALFFVGVDQPVETAPDPVRGNLLALGSGVSWAFAVCGLRWLASSGAGRGSAVAAVVVGNVIASLGALPFALPLGRHDATDWLLVGYLGVFQIALAYVLVTKALEVLPALEASLILLIEPALNPVWAWVFQGERPGVWALVGGGVILGATTIRSVLDARRAPAQAAVPAGVMPSLIETVRIRNGVAPLWYLHLRRLATSCKALGVPLPGELLTPEGGADRIHRLEVGPRGLRDQRAAGRKHRSGRARGGDGGPPAVPSQDHRARPVRPCAGGGAGRRRGRRGSCSRPAGTSRSARSGACSGGRRAGSAPRRSSSGCCRAWPGRGSRS